jgi:hypothetical protein
LGVIASALIVLSAIVLRNDTTELGAIVAISTAFLIALRILVVRGRRRGADAAARGPDSTP